MRAATRMGRMLLAVALLPAGSGCVAINVGEPTVYTHTEMVVTTGKTPLRSEVVSVDAKAQVEGNRLNAWLEAESREEYQRLQHVERVTVKKQKRMGVGVFPGAAQAFWVPPESLLVDFSTKSAYVYSQTLANLAFGIPLVFGTLNTVFLEPFSSFGWNKKDVVTDRNSYEFVNRGEASPTSPQLDALWKFTPYERNAMGVTIFDPKVSQQPNQEEQRKFGQFGLLGVYKYNDIFVSGPSRDGPDRDAGMEAKRRTEKLAGPYEVELQIPGAGISSKAIVGSESRETTFALPQVDRGGRYEATLEFRSLYTGTEDAVRAAWNTRTLKQTVWLQEKPKTPPMRAYVPPTPTPQPQVVERVVEKHYVREVEKRPEGPPYNIEKTLDRTGRTVWRVSILHRHLTAFDVDREVKSKILQELRDDFEGRNPTVPRGEINAFATYTTEDGGRTLVYVGVAESLIPSLESLTYSAETHRGTVTMRLAGGADLRRSKEFVRNHISAIVCDKNVVLTAGERPPDGARYRSLDENFADGVLTVEFEAVE